MATLALFYRDKSTLRNQWLLVSFLGYFIGQITLGFIAPLGPEYEKYRFAALIFYEIYSTFAFYIVYRCAFRKPGTRYLSWVLLVSASIMLSGLIQSLINATPWAELSVYSFLQTALYIWWFNLSLKLLHLNKQVK